jgi:hypothetical protein
VNYWGRGEGRGERGEKRYVPDRRDDGLLDDYVGQQLRRQSGDLLFVEFALNQKSPGGMDPQICGDSQFGGGGFYLSGGKIGLACGRMDINFPEHRGSFWLE